MPATRRRYFNAVMKQIISYNAIIEYAWKKGPTQFSYFLSYEEIKNTNMITIPWQRNRYRFRFQIQIDFISIIYTYLHTFILKQEKYKNNYGGVLIERPVRPEMISH